MIFARRGIEIANYPSVLRHLERYLPQLEPKPVDWRPDRNGEEWSGRKAGAYAWYEVQDAVDYFAEFSRLKLLIKMMAYNSRISVDDGQFLTNNAAVIIPNADAWLHSVLQSPAQWTFQYRTFPHKKDETIAMDIPYLKSIAVPDLAAADRGAMQEATERLRETTALIRAADHAVADWLHHELGLAKLPVPLTAASRLNSDGFVAAVRAALPKRAGITPSRLVQLRAAFADTAEPARAARGTALAEERALSEIVNRAYGLTPEDVALMWRTAPPRMPLAPPAGMDTNTSSNAAADLI